MNFLRSLSALAFCLIIWGCQAENPQDVISPAPQNATEGQLVELAETGLSLRVPDDWAIQKQEHTNPATGIVNTLVTNGDLSEESFREGHGDAIHIAAMACHTEQQRARLSQGILQQDRTQLIQEFRPGDAFMPFEEGTGYEVEFEKEDSLMGSRAFIYETTSSDRCYKISLENTRENFEAKRETYAAIIKSVRFSEK